LHGRQSYIDIDFVVGEYVPAGHKIAVVPGAEPKSQNDPMGQITMFPFVEVVPEAQV
jgi:hypothetical protein